MNNYIYVKNISKDGRTSCDLFKFISNNETRYIIVNFDGFRVLSQTGICEKTFNELLNN